MNWRTKDGKVLKVSEMTDTHLENSIAYKRKDWSGDAFDQIGREIAALETEKNNRIRQRFFGQKSKCMCGGDLYISDCSDREMCFSALKYAWKCNKCPFTSCTIEIPKSLT